MVLYHLENLPLVTLRQRTKSEIQGRESVGESKCPEARRNPSEEEEEVRGRGARKVAEEPGESLEDAGRCRESLGSLERCWSTGSVAKNISLKVTLKLSLSPLHPQVELDTIV
ncbi:hypothetical protein D4764_05G0001560 [Takifugu flavidus]|uniref:Uncharacterized protein n=1 Tax=Takifugu flavidus TaxID=433684 RepID=A0A5C6MYC0_9TELE|nr:hypothetical protein D4764_05G0001560 [Takifugu flavidus]